MTVSRTIYYSDIINHPRRSLSVKDYIEKKTIEINKKEVEKLQYLLDLENADFNLLKMDTDSTIDIFTAKFSDGFEADIKVCTGNHNFFIDPVLFNKLKKEVSLF